MVTFPATLDAESPWGWPKTTAWPWCKRCDEILPCRIVRFWYSVTGPLEKNGGTETAFRRDHCKHIKGEVRTINDRNICEKRSCMKNNGKSPTFKFVSGDERRPSEVQRVSRGWRLPGATHSSADLTSIRKWLEIQAPELSELEIVELELGVVVLT